MVEWISNWAEGIIIAVIIATIIEMILPESNNKKYIKMVIGVYILFTIISPIITKITNKEFDLDTQAYDSYFKENTYQTSANTLAQKNDENVESVFLSNMKADIKQRLKEKGYLVNQIEMDVELKEERNYGRIKKIEIRIQKNEEEDRNEIEDGITKVNTIQIGNTSSQDNTIQQENKTVLTKEEIKDIKTYLNSVYEIDKKNINIIG